MTEKSLEYPFRRELQRLLPNAVVLKHSDSGMIGLPDCSVTYGGRIWWLEFKLLRPPTRLAATNLHNWAELEMKHLLQSDAAQSRLLRRLAAAATGAYYVTFLTTREALIYPVDGTAVPVWTTWKAAPAAVRDLIWSRLPR